jgi:Spy/CpxP family protein refolding chaperone
MNYKSLGLIAVVIIVASGLLTGCARPTIEQRMDRIVQKISQELDLTNDQQDALQKVKVEFFQKLKAQKEARLQLRDEMIVLIKRDAIDAAELEKIKQKMNDLNKELQDFLMAKFIDFHKTLTPAQKEKAVEWIEKTSKKMMEMM